MAPVYADLVSGDDELPAAYAELSYGLMQWQGSAAFGWFELPHDRAYYAGADAGTDLPLTDDCLAAAEDEVFYPDYAGLIVHVAWGYGSRIPTGTPGLSLTLDGVERPYGVVHLRGQPPTPFLLVHEIGHTLGLKHGETLQSQSSVGPMNAGFGLHYVGPNKIHLGWIPEERILTPPPGAVTSIRLERVARPVGTGPLLARIPSQLVANRDFLLEARAPVGTDRTIGGPTVLLTRADSSGNLFLPGPDVALLWAWTTAPPRPGAERGDPIYGDSLEGFFIEADSLMDTGAAVTVIRGWPLELVVEGEGRIEGFGEACTRECRRLAAEPGARVTLTATAGPGLELERWAGDCSGRETCVMDLTNRRVAIAQFLPRLVVNANDLAASLLGGPPLDVTTATRLDRRGNDNGELDLGDLRAWILNR